jgi:hypothetical protein
MREKWDVRKKGYLKIHIAAVNVKINKKILSIKVTDEHAHDSKMLPELVDEIIKSSSTATTTTTKALGKLLGDGAFEGNDVFRYLEDNGILPCIKVRKNFREGWKKDNFFRNLSVLAQKNDLQKWKDSVSYDGQKRWIVETVFSCL